MLHLQFFPHLVETSRFPECEENVTFSFLILLSHDDTNVQCNNDFLILVMTSFSTDLPFSA